MRGPRAIIRVVPILAIVVLLAGCAAPTPAPTRTHPPATPTSTPTPTPTAASAPGSRVPVGCADLVGSSTVQALAGPNAKVEGDESSAPSDPLSIAQLQYGAEDCVWDRTVDGPGAYLSVDVAPDAKAVFQSRFTALMADSAGPPHPAATQNIAGDQSGYWCANELDILGSDAPSLTCDAEMLVGDYWVSIDIGDISAIARPQLTAGITAGLTRIASKLAAAGSPDLPWESHATAAPGICTASTRDVAASTIGLAGHDYDCSWTSPTYGSQGFELLTGGSWAVATLKPVPAGDADYGSAPYVPLTVPGVAAAVASCGSGTCDAYLAVGTSAVEIVTDDPGSAKRAALLSALAGAIQAG